jgi:homoserine O-acetyltransferase
MKTPSATGAWRPGDDPGRRQFLRVAVDRPFILDGGGRLRDVDIAYETWGRLAPDGSNAVLVCHAWTGDSHVTGTADAVRRTPGWWEGVVGPGLALDTDRHYIVGVNVLGGCQGSTGPASPHPEDGRPYGSRFPVVTVRDMVRVQRSLADHLGVARWLSVVGGSMGGMQALEWAIMYPKRVASIIPVCACTEATAQQIAWTAIGRRAIRLDPGWRGGDYYDAPPGGGPHAGLGVARRIAHATYRSEPEINLRFGRKAQPGEQPLAGRGRYAVESYLDHQADKLVRRFDANSYLVLTEAMNSHDVGRGRGGTAAALRRVTARTAVAAIDSDRLYPVPLNREIAEGVPTVLPLRVINSPYGHDGFLIETEAVAEVLAELLTW